MPETVEGEAGETRERRSHAERSAETRIKIIDAVVDCISEIGFQRTTATEISAKAGITWGAVQHHFGGKEGILAAVVDESFTRFEALLDDVDFDGLPIEEAAGLFVDRAWQHFNSPIYRSTFQIVMNYSFDPEIVAKKGAEAELADWQIRMITSWSRVWHRVFPREAQVQPERFHISHYCVAVLSGLAATSMLEPPSAGPPAVELDFLKKTLVDALRAEA
jgi:AcrR family transcriptional regulator